MPVHSTHSKYGLGGSNTFLFHMRLPDSCHLFSRRSPDPVSSVAQDRMTLLSGVLTHGREAENAAKDHE